MKKLPLFLFLIALSGCGGSGSGSEDNEPEYFDLAPYQAASEQLTTKNLVGTWAGVVNIESRRRDMVNIEVNKRSVISMLEVLVLRRNPDSNSLEIAYCGGGFDLINLTGTEVSTDHRILTRQTSRYLTYAVSGSRRVMLPGGIASYVEDVTIDLQLYRVSDSTGPIGSMTTSWSDRSGTISSDIYCATIENHAGGLRVVTASSDSKAPFLFISDDPENFGATAIVSDRSRTNDTVLVNLPATGEHTLSFVREDAGDWMYNFHAVNENGLVVTGYVGLNFLP